MKQDDFGKMEAVLEPYEAVLLLLLGFGSLSISLAFLYNYIRVKVFGDVNSLDRSFDAGGNVSSSLTAVTVAVQLLWPADLLQSSTVNAKYGIAGGFWYSSAVVTNIILFPLLSIAFKTRAPGAKTFLQIIKARFGKPAHIVFCVFALLTNVVITTVLIIAGHTIFKSLINDISDELILLIFATLFGSYSFIGGVGSTFYVSYANAVITFAILSYMIVRLFYSPGEGDSPFGSLEDIYHNVINLTGPVGNEEHSFVTFWSVDSMLWMVQGIFVAASVTFCDQASWQSRIAAKPMEGALGFLYATFIWFAIPATIGTTSGLIYLSHSGGGMNAHNLTDSDIDAGLITPYVAVLAFGNTGGVLVIIMFTMLMVGTGSGEVMGISAIIVYDVYRAYICPFKRNVKPGNCEMCEKLVVGELDEKMDDNGDEEERDEPRKPDFCQCPNVLDCEGCKEDIARILDHSAQDVAHLTIYTCPYHNQYRTYQDHVVRVRNWVILGVSLLLVPYGLVIVKTGININWLILTGASLTIEAFPGIVLAILWVKTTDKGLIIGGISGLVLGVAACLTRAATLEGGLGNFLLNTSEKYAVLAGACASFFGSLSISIIASLCTHTIHSPADAKKEWQKLRDIDNPLSPWKEMYTDDFPDLPKNQKPSHKQLTNNFRKARLTALLGAIFCIGLFVVVVPGAMLSLHVLTFSEFEGYIMTLQIWTFAMTIVVTIFVPVEEILTIVREMRRTWSKKRERSANPENHGLIMT